MDDCRPLIFTGDTCSICSWRKSRFFRKNKCEYFNDVLEESIELGRDKRCARCIDEFGVRSSDLAKRNIEGLETEFIS